MFQNKTSTKTCQGKSPSPGILFKCWFLLILFTCFSTLLITSTQLAYAQESNAIIVQPPNTKAFPTITVDFKLPSNSASAIDTISSEDITLYENDQRVEIAELTRHYHGILFSLVVNPTSDLDTRDGTGTSRYDMLSETLRTWISSRSFQGEDGWSLVTNEGILVQYGDSADEWLSALSAFQPNFRTLQPCLAGLDSAIQMLADRVVPLGMDKAILYITPAPTPDQIESVKDLALQAREAKIQVNVWMVSAPLFLNNDQGGALMDLAAMTGGGFFHFTGEEAIPNPESYLSQLGAYYSASYQSELSQTGTYPLRVEAQVNGLQFSGESQPFTIDIQAPNPIFISPQTSLTLQRPSETAGTSAFYTPESVTWRIMLEFPDGRPREIIASRLYIDGNIVVVNDSPPFDIFTWEVPAQFEAGEYTIQAEIKDILGRSGRTILTPLTVEVQQPETLSRFPLQRIAIILIGVLLGGSLFLLILWLLRQFKDNSLFNSIKDTLYGKNPDSQSPHANPVPHLKPILATLTPLEDGNIFQPVHLTHRKNTLGSSPQRAQILITGDYVQEVHAEIRIREKLVWIQDLHSISGTWVNYANIGTENVQIHTGDLIHIGSRGFRFTINQKPSNQPITVSKYEPYL